LKAGLNHCQPLWAHSRFFRADVYFLRAEDTQNTKEERRKKIRGKELKNTPEYASLGIHLGHAVFKAL